MKKISALDPDSNTSNESAEPLTESVSDKFKRLRSNM